MTTTLDLARVEQVRATPDVVLRNLRITQFYHDTAMELRALTGPDDVSWFAFGTWASRTAGEFIRGEEVPEWGDDLLDLDLPGHLDNLIRTFLREMSAALANGNLLVFEELAPIAVAFVAALKDGRPVEAIVEPLRAQHSPDGEPRLAHAIGAWHDAFATQDGISRAQAMLCANWNAVYHEQQRLQPLLAEAMSLPVVDELAHRLAGDTDEPWFERFAERRLGPLVTRMREDWREFNTRLVMHYELPGSTLRLGRDVEPLVPGIPFPEAVATLTLPTALTLWQTLAGIEGLRGSAANDWLNIQERMRFISTLFRAHQRNPRLFDPPFTAPQLEQIERGVIPSEFERGARVD